MNTSGAPAISTLDTKDLVVALPGDQRPLRRRLRGDRRKAGLEKARDDGVQQRLGHRQRRGLQEGVEKKGGKVVASVVYEPNRPSYRTELQQILAAKPDVIVTGSYVPDSTIILREWYQSGQDAKWILPGWAANPDLIKALGNEVVEGVISVDSVSNENAPSYKALDAAYMKAMGKPISSNVYACMTYDMIICLALAMEVAGPNATIAQINAKIREVSNPDGAKVYSFAEGKKLLAEKKKVNYEGASSKLDFDQYGDVTPDFGVFVIEKGQLVRRDVVSI